MLQDQTATLGSTDQAAAAQETVPQKPSMRRRMQMMLFVLPGFLFQLTWGWYPILVAFFLSFTNSRFLGGEGEMKWVGTENYRRILKDPLVEQAFEVTFKYATLTIVLTFVIPIFVAILLMEMPDSSRRWMMLLWFLPLSGIASTILWRFVFNVEYGLMQYIITNLGLPEQRFLNDADMVLFWLIFPGILLFGPGLIYMATLQGIPVSYYEAAEIEGASFWRKIWTISLPRLRPVIAMMLTFAIIGSLQQFQWPQIMTRGEPGGASRTVVMYLYTMWGEFRFGDSVALAFVLFAVIMTVTIIYRTLFKEDPDS